MQANRPFKVTGTVWLCKGKCTGKLLLGQGLTKTKRISPWLNSCLYRLFVTGKEINFLKSFWKFFSFAENAVCSDSWSVLETISPFFVVNTAPADQSSWAMLFICFRARKPLHQRPPNQISEYNGQSELHVTDCPAAIDINDTFSI